MIKDIIVNLGLGDSDPAGNFAISVAETYEAHVLGTAFTYEPIVPGTMMGGIPPEYIESQRAEAEKVALTAITRFEDAAARSGVSFEGRMLTATISGAAEQFARMARRFDLVVVGQPRPEQAALEEVLGESALFDSGRPVIFVPYIQKKGLKLDRVMVCWDGSSAASRAIGDALPLLSKTTRVEVVIVATGQPKSDEVPGADIGQHLARHGMDVEVKRITAPDIDVQSALLSYAADSSADLMVMGGYGHSRLREFVLGGVTRGILETMTVPVLMSH